MSTGCPAASTTVRLARVRASVPPQSTNRARFGADTARPYHGAVRRRESFTQASRYRHTTCPRLGPGHPARHRNFTRSVIDRSHSAARLVFDEDEYVRPRGPARRRRGHHRSRRDPRGATGARLGARAPRARRRRGRGKAVRAAGRRGAGAPPAEARHIEEATVIAPTPTRFRWLERGDGEPVLLLHGLMGEMGHWESTLEALGPFRRPIALELPIFDPDLIDVSVEALAGYVRRFMEAFELPPAIVCGNSLGSHIALELALSSPGWVEGLVLTGSSGLFERTFTNRVPHQPTRAYVRERMEEIFYDPTLVTPSGSSRSVASSQHAAPRSACSRQRARRSGITSRTGSARSVCRPCSCGARTTASRRPTWPSVSTRASAAPSSCTCPTAVTRRCSSGRRRSTPPSATGSSRPARGARSRMAVRAAGRRGAGAPPAEARHMEDARDRAHRRRGAPRLRGAPSPDAQIGRAHV